MQFSVESTGDIQRKINIEVPADRLDREFDKQLKSMRGRVRIDGFRPGKVPMSVVRERYGDAVYNDVAGQVVQETLFEAIEKEELKIAGSPSVTPEVMEVGKDLKFFAEVEIYPEFSLADLSTLEINNPNVEIQEADIDKMIETLRAQQQSFSAIDRAAQDDDQVTINFAGTLDGEGFEGGSAEGYQFVLGAGRMLPDFETAVSGMSVGDTKTADVAFPEDYNADNLKGKTAQFEISLTAVEEPILPELNEEFFKKFGIDVSDVESFRVDVSKNMQRELQQAKKSLVKNAVMDGLFEQHEVSVPKILVDNEINVIREELGQNGSGQDFSSLPNDLFEAQAHRRVKLGLVVGEIIKANNIEKDTGRVEAMVRELAESYEDSEAFVQYYMSNPQALQSVEAAVMEDMIVEWVMEQAIVTEKEMDFDAAMAEARGGAR